MLVFVCCRIGLMHVGKVWRRNVHREPSFCPLAETRFGSRRHFRPPNMAGEAGLSAAEVAPEKRLSSLSGTFGRRRCRRTCPVLPSFACFCMIVLRCFRGFLGSILELCLCMFGPSLESTCVGSDPRNRGPQQ